MLGPSVLAVGPKLQLRVGQFVGSISVNSIHRRISPRARPVRAFCFSGAAGGEKTRRRDRCANTCHAPHQQSKPASLARAAPPVDRPGNPSTTQETQEMQEIRCGSCNRKLGVGEYTRLTIKCPRCGCMNVMKAERLQSAGQRAPDIESAHVWPARPTNDR